MATPRYTGTNINVERRTEDDFPDLHDDLEKAAQPRMSAQAIDEILMLSRLMEEKAFVPMRTEEYIPRSEKSEIEARMFQHKRSEMGGRNYAKTFSQREMRERGYRRDESFHSCPLKPFLFFGGQENRRHHNIKCQYDEASNSYIPPLDYKLYETVEMDAQMAPRISEMNKTIQIYTYDRAILEGFPDGVLRYVYVLDACSSIAESMIKRAVEEGMFDG